MSNKLPQGYYTVNSMMFFPYFPAQLFLSWFSFIPKGLVSPNPETGHKTKPFTKCQVSHFREV